jgi:hypothetical protein
VSNLRLHPSQPARRSKGEIPTGHVRRRGPVFPPSLLFFDQPRRKNGRCHGAPHVLSNRHKRTCIPVSEAWETLGAERALEQGGNEGVGIERLKIVCGLA